MTESEVTAREGTTATEVASDLAEEPHVAEGMVTEEVFQPPDLDDYINVETEDDADDVDPPFEEEKDSIQSDPQEDSDDDLRIVVNDALTDARADAPPETLRNEELYEESSPPSSDSSHVEEVGPPRTSVLKPIPTASSATAPSRLLVHERPLASLIPRHSSMSLTT